MNLLLIYLKLKLFIILHFCKIYLLNKDFLHLHMIIQQYDQNYYLNVYLYNIFFSFQIYFLIKNLK